MTNIFRSVWRYLKQTDRVLILVSLLAAGFGLLLVYSATHASGRVFTTQILGIVVGCIIMIAVSKIDYHDMAKAWKWIALVSISLMILTLLIGSSRAGSQDRAWIHIGSNTIQPAEFIKVAFVITFAKHYDSVKERIGSLHQVLLLTLHGLIPMVLLILQKDMGMMLVFALMFIFMLFMANVRLRYFALAAIVLFAGSPLIWSKVLGATQKNRILALFDPAKYANDAYQQTQGRLAIGSGELSGYGLLHGPLTQGPSYLLPEKQNDMIFAVAGEELGFIGCLLILALFFVLLMRILGDARKAKDGMGAIICVGVFASFLVQMAVNISAALMVFPITGISLPFFSSGGSSVVSGFLGVGVVLSVYMHRSTQLFAEKS